METGRLLALAFPLAVVLAMAPALQAQGQAPKLPDDDATDDEEPEEDLEEDLEEEGGKSEEDPDEDGFEIDMNALGGMDPAADLGGPGPLSGDQAAAAALEDWTERDLEILELHGYFRVRPELYHKFYLRNDDALFARPLEQRINSTTDPDGYLGKDCRSKDSYSACQNNSLAGANLRLRVEPTINVSETVWIKSQIDFLDNVMLGSSPRWYQNYGSGEMVETGTVQGFNMGPPDSDMIVVRRAWGEVMTPLGQLRFGRMGSHWGLGMLHNAGNGIDQDFGDTVDRLMFAAKINDWLLAPAFDFPSEGVSAVSSAGRPFDVAQLDDAYQLVAIIAYKHDEEAQRALLKRGDWLINTGLHFTYRSQVLSYETTAGPLSRSVDDGHFYRRDMWLVAPDFWFQLLYGTFHLELEVALIYGELGNPDQDLANFDEARRLTLTQFGGVLQADYGLLSDQLRLGLEFGFASGDRHVEGVNPPSTFDQDNRPDDTGFTQFSFNPAYNTDLILYRHILGSVSGTYYFHPWLRYDFLRSSMGKNLGVQADVIYSRAVFAESTISDGNANIGIELNAQVMYVSADNFHAGLKYGVLFPLGAFEGTWDPDGDPATDNSHRDTDLTVPQTLQVLLGISF